MKLKTGIMAKLGASICITAALSGTACAQEDINPFDDVPRSHWAYEEINQLAKDGLVDGYKDGTFRGNEVLTRYEIAAIVGRAVSSINHNRGNITDADYAAVQKLGEEFRYELKTMGVRIAELEKYKSNAGLYGDVRMRYISNRSNRSIDTDEHTSARFDERIRLGYWSEVAPDFYFTARMRADLVQGEEFDDRDYYSWGTSSKYDSGTKYDSTSNVTMDLAEAKWVRDDFEVELGRFNPTIGQGAIWSSEGEGSIDGFYATYKPTDNFSMSAGYGTVSPSMQDKYFEIQDEDIYTPSFLYNASLKSGTTEFTLGMLKTLGGSSDTKMYEMADMTDWSRKDVNYAMEQYSIGFNSQVTPRLKLMGEWITNRADRDIPADSTYILADDAKGTDWDWKKQAVPTQRNGYWLGLSYGNYDRQKANTYKVDLTYLKMGNWAIDSSFYPHSLMVRGGDGLGLDGEKGWGLGMAYMLAPRVELNANYFWTKPYDAKASGFDKYKSPWQISLNFDF